MSDRLVGEFSGDPVEFRLFTECASVCVSGCGKWCVCGSRVSGAQGVCLSP